MRIEKRGSNYRVQIQERGKRYSFTFSHKPTKKEVYLMLTKEKEVKTDGTLKDYAEKYISLKSNILSPSTIKGYNCYIRAIAPSLLLTKLCKIDITILQKFINEFSLTHSPKTVQNVFGFVSIILKTFRPDFLFKVSLPRKTKREPYIPTIDDLRVLIKESNGTRYLSPILLAIFGLRRSEIMGLTKDDIKDNYIIVNKAKVVDNDNKLVVKSTKTYTDRIVYMPPQIIQIIKNSPLYNYDPSEISKFMKRVQKKNNMQQFSLHKLRHFYASICHYYNMPDLYIQKQGGWLNNTTMRSIYTHALDSERQYLTQNINNKIAENLLENAPRMHQEEMKIDKTY